VLEGQLAAAGHACTARRLDVDPAGADADANANADANTDRMHDAGSIRLARWRHVREWQLAAARNGADANADTDADADALTGARAAGLLDARSVRLTRWRHVRQRQLAAADDADTDTNADANTDADANPNASRGPDDVDDYAARQSDDRRGPAGLEVSISRRTAMGPDALGHEHASIQRQRRLSEHAGTAPGVPRAPSGGGQRPERAGRGHQHANAGHLHQPA
jgi:hypothetical protein